MNSLRRAGWTGLLLAGGACCALFAASVALAAKPGGGGGDTDTKPPVAIVPVPGDFELQPQLGGVLDKATDVVWGYSLGALEGSANYDWSSVAIVPARYPAAFAGAADNQRYVAGLWTERANSVRNSDPALAAEYDANAAKCLADADTLTAAGAVATAYAGQWRAPTFAEAQSAVSRGLFTTGAGGLNVWTPVPTDPLGTSAEGAGWYWTSTAGGRKRGNETGWTFNAFDGSGWRITAFSRVLLVRTHTPSP